MVIIREIIIFVIFAVLFFFREAILAYPFQNGFYAVLLGFLIFFGYPIYLIFRVTLYGSQKVKSKIVQGISSWLFIAFLILLVVLFSKLLNFNIL